MKIQLNVVLRVAATALLCLTASVRAEEPANLFERWTTFSPAYRDAYQSFWGGYDDEAARIARPSAEASDVHSIFLMGWLYSRGRSTETPADQCVAAQWFQKAARQGYPPAVAELAFNLYTGTGLVQDHLAANRYARNAYESLELWKGQAETENGARGLKDFLERYRVLSLVTINFTQHALRLLPSDAVALPDVFLKDPDGNVIGYKRRPHVFVSLDDALPPPLEIQISAQEPCKRPLSPANPDWPEFRPINPSWLSTE
ncbi:MAG: sel1 repeat family protein [Rhodobacteraceae bacterium]|nr:sel1 repeat family protein [Paracoccaceae bacterium]